MGQKTNLKLFFSLFLGHFRAGIFLGGIIYSSAPDLNLLPLICGLPCNGRAAGQSQRLYSGVVGVFNWHYLSSPPQVLRFSQFGLEIGGLTSTCR
jgi:hypothetical protein